MSRLFTACMMTLACLPLQAMGADRFEIELLVFAWGPNGRPDQDAQEQFIVPVPSYPANLVALAPARDADFAPWLPGQEASLRENDRLLEDAISWSLLPLQEKDSPDLLSGLVYEKEDLLLGLPLPAPPAEALTAGPEPPAEKIVKDLFSGMRQQPDWRLRPTGEHRLTGAARRIDRSSLLRLLTHLMWRQPVSTLGKGEAMLIQAGQMQGDIRELEGFVIIERARFLHLQVNLWFTSFRPAGGEAVTQFRPDEAQEGPEYTDQPVRRQYQLQQSRRLNRDELHYIDHPFLGLLVRIRSLR